MRFGEQLKRLREQKGLGIKRLAPQLRVNYTYLSKLEHGELQPSVDLVKRIADYFGCERDLLLLAAGKVPDDVLSILREQPEESLRMLRTRFARQVAGGEEDK
jgi:transcriptional regulator with XRE-family HTH domain